MFLDRKLIILHQRLQKDSLVNSMAFAVLLFRKYDFFHLKYFNWNVSLILMKHTFQRTEKDLNLPILRNTQTKSVL